MTLYRRFISYFTVIAHPLHELLGKGTLDKLNLNDDQLKALGANIDKVCSTPMLGLPKPNKPYSAHTDASDYAIGCLLFQKHEEGKENQLDTFLELLTPLSETNQQRSFGFQAIIDIKTDFKTQISSI